MSNRPENTYRFKGIKVNDWGKGKFSIEKSYFKKEGDSGQWVDTKYFFKNELEELRKLIDQALEDGGSTNLLDSMPQAEPQPAAFDDDDIPF